MPLPKKRIVPKNNGNQDGAAKLKIGIKKSLRGGYSIGQSSATAINVS